MTFGMAAMIAGASPAAAQPAPIAPVAPSAQAWRAFALQDVQAAHEIYSANHPGMHDPANPGFPALLARARDEGLAAARQSADYAGYVDALGAFTAVLADGHAQILPGPPPPSEAVREWPGFIAAWRGDRMLVHQAEPGLGVNRGDAIVACDSHPIVDFVRHRLRTRRFRPREAGDWWLRGPLAFVSSAGLAAGRPQSCAFRQAGGHVISVTLSWRPAPQAYNRMLELATDGERTEIGLTEPRPGLFLIGMPDFPSDPAGVQAFRAMFDALAHRRGDLLRAHAIVIDLRHNGGGASIWSRQTAQALWGVGVVEGAMHAYFRRSEIWWRASDSNIAALTGIENQVRSSGDTASADTIRGIAEGMRGARARGRLFNTGRAEAGPASGPPPRTDLRAPVYVIVPGRCASACLDALDVFTRFGNVRLIGAPTSADSAYLEVRPAPLPSGHAQMLVPINLWIRRPRAPGQVYRPDIPLNDLDWSTATFLDRIERDLAKSGRHPAARERAG